jgi:spectinomycin phosphotransferase
VLGRPAHISDERVRSALHEGWGIDASLRYAPVGAGSYHWHATSSDGSRAFVTIDDLDSKTWLEPSSFDGLRQAFETATRLREHGLDFVVAPLRSREGETLLPLDERYTIAVFPHVDGAAGEWGPHDLSVLPDVVRMLATLHEATGPVAAVVRHAGVELPGREHLARALAELSSPWQGGPLAEPARAAVAAGATELAELLAHADRLAADLGSTEVVTHGEPHAGNVMQTGSGLALVDWDTVAVAPPERDLWMLPDFGDLYTELTGTSVDPQALDYFRLLWELKDWAEYLNLLRAPHEQTEDTLRSLGALRRVAEVHAEWLGG